MPRGTKKYVRLTHNHPGAPESKEGSWPKWVRLDEPLEELFDLEADIGESSNLAASRPENVRSMGAAVEDWNKLGALPAFGFDTAEGKLPFNMDRKKQNN